MSDNFVLYLTLFNIMNAESKKIILLLINILIIIYGKAQLTISGEIRPRFEYRHGYATPIDTLQKSSQFVQQRTRLNFGYKSEKIKIGLTLQDVRVWGNQSQLNTSDANTYGLHEGWAEYFFSKKISMKMGRQELSYDDERIMGAVGWAQQARSHDAFILKYTDSTWAIHGGIAYNQDKVNNTASSYTTISSYKEMQYLWINKQIKNIKISLLGLNVGQQSPVAINSTRYITTTGTRIEYKTKPFFAGLNFYYQNGNDITSTTDGKPKKVNALLGGIDLAYTLKEKFTIGMGYEYISGQSKTDTSRAYNNINRAFNPVFGTNHKFNGYMDYYYVSGHFNNVGLQDIILRLNYKQKAWNVSLDFHQFMTAANALNTKELAKTGQYKALDSNLGSEIDFTLVYTLPAGVSVTGGYSHYLTSNTIATIKNVKDYKGDGRTNLVSNWAYIMITFKPVFLNK